jgi:serine/threonine protein kinase
MGDVNQLLEVGRRERLVAELAESEGDVAGGSSSGAKEVTWAELKAELDTLVMALRAPPGDEFEEESDCRRAIELVESIGRPLDASPSASVVVGDSPTVNVIEFDRLGPYEVTAKLGEGGMGAVYKAVHPKLKRTVAIKVLPARRMKNAASILRFEREMEAIGALNHPNIVTAHDAGEDAGMHYLVMEYVDGLDLSTLVRRVGPLAPADACEIVRQAALGLAEASARGIVHRDVKPSNLMLAAAPTEAAVSLVKILDFGLARLSPLHGEADDLTTSGLIMGTLKYMAPEQCSQSHEVDVRADIYSLGATLYKLLCGVSPFSDIRFDSPLALLAALGNEGPPALAARRPDVPPQLAAIVHRMIAKNPADRFAAPQDVIEALTPWARGADLTELLNRARIATDSFDLARHAAPRSPTPASSGLARDVRLRWPLWSLLLAGLGLLTITAAFLWNRPAPEDASFAQSRSAVEWLALHNARVGVFTNQDKYIEIAAGDPLPTAPFQLTAADLRSDKLIRDDDLARFQGLPQLELLNLSFTNIGDEGLARLNDLPKLTNVYLVATRITDAGLADLVQFNRLTSLFIAKTAVTDSGLAHLAAIPTLNELNLVGCKLTDAGLVHVQSLKSLRTLNLQDTSVTARGVARLQLALPACSIQSDFTDEEISDAAINDAKLKN